MFKLIKLAFYGFLGYAIYEFIRGFTEDGSGREIVGTARHGSSELNRALDRDDNRVNMTGPARGERVMSNEPTGQSIPHIVGRGVVSR